MARTKPPKSSAEFFMNLPIEDLQKKFLTTKKLWEKNKKSGEIPFSEYLDGRVSEMEARLFGKSSISKEAKVIDEEDEFDDEENDEIDNPYANLYIGSDYALLDAMVKKNSISFGDILLNCATNEKLKYFSRYAEKLTDKEYWDNLRYVYSMHDYQELPFELYVALFSSKRKGKQHLMNKKEHAFLKSLPDEITIYRGMSKEEFNGNIFGISWTLSKNVASFFANRSLYGEKNKKVKKLVIKKETITAYFTDRNEEEIIYFKTKK